jgi:hypothetical protein
MTRSSLVLFASLLVACGSVPQSSMKVPQPLDPELYRQEIGLIDAAVFENGPLDEDHQMELVVGVDQLLRNLRLDDEAPATAQALTNEMMNIYGRIPQEGTSTTMEKSGIREEWTRIRSTYFADADWFRHSTGDPVQDPRAVPPMDPGIALQRNGVRARTMLNEALMTLMVLAGTDQKDLRVDKNEELARLERLFKAPSPIDDPNFHVVRNEGLETIRYLREWMATGYDTLPPGRNLVERMVEHLSAAEDALKEMEMGEP